MNSSRELLEHRSRSPELSGKKVPGNDIVREGQVCKACRNVWNEWTADSAIDGTT